MKGGFTTINNAYEDSEQLEKGGRRTWTVLESTVRYTVTLVS